ncbi:MAG: ammonium transporter [Parvularculaceae bacterium]
MKRFFLVLTVLVVGAHPAFAQEPIEMQPASETSRLLFDTLLSLSAGLMAMVVIVGLCAREAGLVRAKNAVASCTKMITLTAICSLAAWVAGYNLIFSVEPGGFLGDFVVWSVPENETDERASAAQFLQVALASAIGMAIVSGAVAERIRFWPFAIFAAAYSALIFPIAASWIWGNGYLAAAWKYSDFAGAALIHGCGGWAALAGAVILGPRLARYDGEEPREQPPSNVGLAAVGGLLIWVSLLALSAGAHLSFSSAADAVAISRILVNSQLAAAGGVFAALVLTEIIYKRVDLPILINGAVGALVAISAGPIEPALWQAVTIGAFSGVIVTVTGPLLDRFRIDDAVGAIPTHLVCALWGALIVPWSNESATYLGQIAGAVVIGAFSLTMGILFWTGLRYTVGLRVTAERELAGLDSRPEASPRPRL